METLVLSAKDVNAVALGAQLIKEGKVVGFPTETVYGLGADVYQNDAVEAIFAAKGRPADNPLIAHISDQSMLDNMVADVPPMAQKLAQIFWPGPLTMIFPSKGTVSRAVTAGLDTLAVRFPVHPAAQRLIAEAGVPIAAPSANRSGSPSPTNAQDVFQDMNGRIPLILDGGPSGIGLESTVLDVTGRQPLILRPGGITKVMLEQALDTEVLVHQSALKPLSGVARSPGMKYKHYAPQAQVTLVEGGPEAMANTICGLYDTCPKNSCILGTEENRAVYGERNFALLGSRANPETIAHNLFTLLREMDRQGYEAIFCETVQADGIGLAIMNRLVRAAGYNIVKAM